MIDLMKMLLVVSMLESPTTLEKRASLPVRHKGDEIGIYGDRERNVVRWIEATGVRVTVAQVAMDYDLQTEAAIWYAKHEVGLRITPAEFLRRWRQGPNSDPAKASDKVRAYVADGVKRYDELMKKREVAKP